jgi:hypothetical protein
MAAMAASERNVGLEHSSSFPVHALLSAIDVACDHTTRWSYALSQSLGDRSVTAAEFQAPPARTDSQPRNVSDLERVQQRRHERQTVPFALQFVRQNVVSHCPKELGDVSGFERLCNFVA